MAIKQFPMCKGGTKHAIDLMTGRKPGQDLTPADPSMISQHGLQTVLCSVECIQASI